MNFRPRNFYASPLFLCLNNMKLPDKIILENYLLMRKAINKFLLSLFSNWFTFSYERHQYETSSSAKGLLKISIINTK